MSPIDILASLCENGGIAFCRDVDLSGKCTFRIGGFADILLTPSCVEQIALVMNLARRARVRLMVLGRGSNLLFPDAGFRGAIMHLGKNFAGIRDTGDREIDCDSGLSLFELCEHALKRGLSGLEFAYGIPGTLGGAVCMNAGAYGGEMRDVLVSTRHLEPDGSPGELRGEEMGLCYRHSAYSDGGRVITGASVRLSPGDPAEIRAKMNDYMARRRDKQPLELPSAGSTFRRPQGAYASALIDSCGLKGRRVGGAVVSEKHAGFVVNTGDATCADVLALIEIIREEVRRQTGYELECEVKIIE